MKEDATCSRCGEGFACGARDHAPCWCAALHVVPATLARLAAERDGCLCPGCLGALATPRNKSADDDDATRDGIAQCVVPRPA